eukprot:scaffold8.g1702.t1
MTETVLEAEKPDFVVLLGDMVSGSACNQTQLQASLADGALKTLKPTVAGPDAGKPCGAGWFAGVWANVTAPLHAARVPYTLIAGNHDAEADLTKAQIVDLALAQGNGLALVKQGPAGLAGATNFHLDVASPDGRRAGRKCCAAPRRGMAWRAGGGVAARLWFFDSTQRGCEGVDGAGCTTNATVDWLRETAAGLPPAPSVGFVHIPVAQAMDAWAQGSAVVGSRGEPSNCQALDLGLFDAARDAGITSLWSGHDHDNNYSGVLDGVRVGYARKSGYGSYLPQSLQVGATVLQVELGASGMANSRAWVRGADGSVEELAAPSADARATGEQAECTVGGLFCTLRKDLWACASEPGDN